MLKALRSEFSAVLLGVALLTSCRDKAPTATPDPVAVAATTKSPGKGAVIETNDVAVVTANRIEIPRVGHDPIILSLPVVKGLRDAATDAKVNALLAPEAILDESLDDIRADAKAVTSAADMASGVQGSSYEVRYNQHGVLEIEASVEFMGAYPSTNRFHALIDLRKGTPIGADAFLPARVPGLVTRLDAMLKKEVKTSDASKDPDFASLVADAKYDTADLADFSVSDAGLTFNHDYDFPHVALALQPPGRFFLAWADVAADIDPVGPLARVHPVP